MNKIDKNKNIAFFVLWLAIVIFMSFGLLIATIEASDAYAVRSISVIGFFAYMLWFSGGKLGRAYRSMVGKYIDEHTSNGGITSFERILLWTLVVIVIYQQSQLRTDDRISDIAADAAADIFQDKECVTEDFLFNEYASREDIQEVIDKLNDRIWSLEYDRDNK
jgi:hypothetical protein